MLKRLFIALFAVTLAGPAMAAGGDVELQKRDWSFSGPFGTFDKAAMQRGFQAYREVCAGCHGMKLIAFRNFSDLGYNNDEIKAIAAQYEVQAGPNDDGEILCVRDLLPTVFHLPMPMTMQLVPAITVPCHPICH